MATAGKVLFDITVKPAYSKVKITKKLLEKIEEMWTC